MIIKDYIDLKKFLIYDWAFITNCSNLEAISYVHLYKRRWAIETTYKQFKAFRIKTISTNPVTRLFYFTISMLLLLIWNLHYKTKTTFKLFTTILYEQQFFQQLNIPYTFLL